MNWPEWQAWVDQNCVGILRDYANPHKFWWAWKEDMVFLPEQYVDKIDKAQVTEKQQPVISWDDAGVGASQYRWAEDIGTTLSEYVNVGATDFAGQVLTVPSPEWILKHFRDVPGVHTGQVIKLDGHGSRLLRVYKGWRMPDMKKTGVNTAFQDRFNVMLPDPVFAEYDQTRRLYAKIVKERLRYVIQQLAKQGKEKAAAKLKEELKEQGFDLDKSEDERTAPRTKGGTPIPEKDAIEIIKKVAYLGLKLSKLELGSPERAKILGEVRQFLDSTVHVEWTELGEKVGLSRSDIERVKNEVDRLASEADKAGQ